jgi:ribosome recycling factor
MTDAIVHLTTEFSSIRAGGRATAEQLSGIMVRAYGSSSPIEALGTIATRNATTLLVSTLHQLSHFWLCLLWLNDLVLVL